MPVKNIWNLKTMQLRMDRHFEAAPERVFDAWLDPACPGSPWHGVGRALLTAEVDGLFYRMHRSKDDAFELHHYGRFTELERPRRLQYTWVSQHTQGLESVVTMEFAKKGKGTQITLLHENLPDDEKGRMHEAGWQYYLGLLADAMLAHSEGA